MTLHRRAHLLAAAALACFSTTALAQLRIVSYNIEADIGGFTTPRPGMDAVLQGIGTDSFGGFAHSIDILTLQETTSNATTVQPIVDMLNSHTTPGTYAMSTYQGSTSGGIVSGGNGPNALIYNTNTLTLIASVGIGTPSGSSEARQEIRYQFRPVGYTSSADFYVYCGHLKSGSDDTGTDNSELRRNKEAIILRNDANTLPAGSRIIYTGDYNPFKSSSEPAWITMTTPGTFSTNTGIDPINLGNGSWTDSSSTFKFAYTDSTTSLKYRDDLQLPTAPVMDGHGFSFISGSYHPFSNNGNVNVNAGSPNANVKTASDHYPIMADYRLPAKMSVAVGSVPAQVIVGGSATLSVNVSNAAPVQLAVGADGLDYSLTSNGSLSGSGNGANVAALSAGNNHVVTFNTSTVGTKTGTISVSSTSQEVANGTFAQQVSTQVIDHSQPSLASASDLNIATIDFGIKGRDLGGGTSAFAIYNRLGNGTTAGLDLDSVVGVGSTGQLATTASPFSNLAATGSHAFNAYINATVNGNVSATYTMNLSDQDLPGATTRGPLTLVLKGIIATPGDTDLNDSIDGSDYAHVDTTFLNETGGNTIGGWANGDFNGDGKVDGSDYALIDFYFLQQQQGSLASALAILGGDDSDAGNSEALSLIDQHFDEFGGAYGSQFIAAAPEPAGAMLLAGVAASAAMKRRRRR